MVLVAAVILAAGTVAACTPQPTVPIAPDSPVVSPPEPDLVGPLRIIDDRLVDAAGRTVLIHGLNSVAKSEPFLSTVTPTAIGDATATSDALRPSMSNHPSGSHATTSCTGSFAFSRCFAATRSNSATGTIGGIGMWMIVEGSWRVPSRALRTP